MVQLEHDFKKYPELTNNQLPMFEFDSPHPQITKDFWATVVRVKDGDTVEVEWIERDFKFPIRMLLIAAPELKEEGGPESRDWLASMIEGQEVQVVVDPFNRVGKWGRLLGTIRWGGININELSMTMGHSILFNREGEFATN